MQSASQDNIQPRPLEQSIKIKNRGNIHVSSHWLRHGGYWVTWRSINCYGTRRYNKTLMMAQAAYIIIVYTVHQYIITQTWVE